MLSSKLLDAAVDAFKQKFVSVCQSGDPDRFDVLSPHAMAALSRALRDAAQAAGQAGLHCYLQDRDPRAASVVHEGRRYRYKASVPKSLFTLFGEVTVSRSVYGNDAHGGYVVPLDRSLQLAKDDSATLEVREIVLYAGSSSSPQEIETLLGKVSLCRLSRTAIQNILTRDGARMEALSEPLTDVLSKESWPSTDAQTLVASMDGANLRLREVGVKVGRPAQRPQADISDESLSTFRNAMVGAISWYARDTDGFARRINSTYLARMPEDNAPIFKSQFQHVLATAVDAAADLHRPIRKVLLCDGHRAIWNYAASCPTLKGFDFLLDFYHTTEHLSKAAEAIFGASSPAGQRWYHKWREALKTDAAAPGAIIRSIDGYLTRCPMPASRKADLKRQRTFFKRNKHMMTYAVFLKRGLPIGSGPVEAAAKTIVKQRMCRSGMRWSRTGGQHILTLRAHVKSGTWDRCWSTYTELLKDAA